jgi:predicted AAA+ superfamily ATPase
MISDLKLLETLKKENLWDKEIDTGIERSIYLRELQQYITRKEIIVLKGIRRCGKSTIMKQLMKRLIKQNVSKEQLLYINLESYELRNSHSIELFEKILDIYKQHINSNSKVYFFIDEDISYNIFGVEITD